MSPINSHSALTGLIKRGTYKPAAGWGVFALQVVGASALLAVFLLWSAGAVSWIGLKTAYLQRIGLLAVVICGGAAIYFIALRIGGLKVKQLLKR